MSDIIKKKVCKCENCGNEAEMVITCSLDDDQAEQGQPAQSAAPQQVKGKGTCSHCGNEADMWVDL